MSSLSPRLAVALRNLREARDYTLLTLAGIDPGDWFRLSESRVTHVAWQVGHLAMADYRLALERIRGPHPEDEVLISQDFLCKFGKASVPDPDPASNPSPAELCATLERVRTRVLEVLPSIPDDALDEPPFRPHPLFSDKLGSLLWCARHEMTHVGQIGLLKRTFGHPPRW